MMDANELATVAYETMSGIDLTAHDRGQIYGVLQMALRTLEAQHAALLAEADEETAEAKKLWREALAELDALKVDRDAVLAANHALNVDLRKAQTEIELAAKALEFSEGKVGRLVDELTITTQECDYLKNEKALFLRDEGPQGALSVALKDRDSAVLEMKVAQRAADEFKSQRSLAESELSRCRSDRDMFKRLRDQYMAERDAYADKMEAAQTQLAERSAAVDHLAACVTGRDVAMSNLWRIVADKADAYTSQEIYRTFREWETALHAMPPGAVQVAKTEELHGMAKVHLVPAGSEDL